MVAVVDISDAVLIFCGPIHFFGTVGEVNRTSEGVSAEGIQLIRNVSPTVVLERIEQEEVVE